MARACSSSASSTAFSLESLKVRPVRREVIRDGISIVQRRDGFSGCVGIGSFAGWAPPSCRYAPAGPARRLGMGGLDRRRGAYDISQPSPPRALVCARGGRRRQYPRERRGSSSWRACARQGLPGVRLSNRGVVTSGDGADRVGASGVDGAKSRRRRQAMRNRSSDARQQPCDGRNDVRHDFPDLLDDCRLHRAARPRSRRCLHGYMSKQRASARIAARGEAKRAPCAAVQRFGGGDVSAVKRAAVGPAGGAPGVARNGRNDGGSVSAARYRFGARNWPAVSGIVSALNLRANGGIVTTPRLSRHWRHPPPPSRSSRAAARRVAAGRALPIRTCPRADADPVEAGNRFAQCRSGGA